MATLASKRARWRRHLDRIRAEQVEWLSRHVEVFKLFQKSVKAGGLRKGGPAQELANWMAVNYLVFAAVWVRKVAEPAPPKPKKLGVKDKRIISLRAFLEELLTEAGSLSFARFRRLFRGTSVPEKIIRAQWRRAVGDRDSITRTRIKADIRRILCVSQEVKKFVDKQVAHTGLNRKLNIGTSFGAIREAAQVFEATLRKYDLIVFGRSVQPPSIEVAATVRMLAATWAAAET